MRSLCLLPLAAALLAAASPPPPYAGLATDYGYVELTDMALQADVVVAADIAKATLLKDAAGVPAGKARYYVEADARALIGGRAELPPVLAYLVDVPLANPKAKPRLKGVPVLLLADLAGKPGELRLVAPRAQVPRTPENEQRVRAILSAAVAPDAPPQITGVTRAFHVAGSLPGEGESQIFLRTSDGRPISLSVLRRPGERPRWGIALSELVDDSAAPPPANSLLWYRLACGLPRALPAAATAGAEPADAQQASEDYRLVLEGLGPCMRG
jgi:hypothetical protein